MSKSNISIMNDAEKKIVEVLETEEYKQTVFNSSNMVTFFSLMIVIGFFVQYLFNSPSVDGHSGQATAEIWSYGIILFSLICILIFQLVIPNTVKSSGIATTIPILCLLVAFFWAISIRIKYFKEINKSEVPNDYYAWSSITNFLLTLEALLLVFIIKREIDNVLQPSKMNYKLIGEQESMKVAFGNFILIFTIFVILGIQQVILDNFTVNG